MKVPRFKIAFLFILFGVSHLPGSQIYKDVAYGQEQQACFTEVVLAAKNLRYALSDLASFSYIFEPQGEALVVSELAARQVGVVEYKLGSICHVDEVIAMRELVRDSLDKVRKAFRASTTLSNEPEAFTAFRAMVTRWEDFRDLVSDLQGDDPAPTPVPTPLPIDRCSYHSSSKSCRSSSGCEWDYYKSECFIASGQSCTYYTRHGSRACNGQSNCEWDYYKSECFIASGQSCTYYTRHGSRACNGQSTCEWDYYKSECFIARGESCSYYTRHGSRACNGQSNCEWDYDNSTCKYGRS